MRSFKLLTKNFDKMTEEILEEIILGYIAKELKDEIQIGRQVKLAKTIIQALRIHDVAGQSEDSVCHRCGSTCN